MRASVFIATSLDGFIARTNGDIDWLGEPQEGGEDQGYQAFIDTVDFVVTGRNSYEKVLSFGIPWPYEKPVVVLTNRPLDIPSEQESRATPEKRRLRAWLRGVPSDGTFVRPMLNPIRKRCR